MLALVTVRRRLRSPVVDVAAVVVLGAAAYVALAWHTDAMESARHVFVGGAMARLALLVLVAGLADRSAAPVRLDGSPDT
jgi:hypothetical protein